MKANEMHYFSNLFDKVRYMFWTSPKSIIRNISALKAIHATGVYNVEILLMMDSGLVRNM